MLGSGAGYRLGIFRCCPKRHRTHLDAGPLTLHTLGFPKAFPEFAQGGGVSRGKRGSEHTPGRSAWQTIGPWWGRKAGCASVPVREGTPSFRFFGDVVCMPWRMMNSNQPQQILAAAPALRLLPATRRREGVESWSPETPLSPQSLGERAGFPAPANAGQLVEGARWAWVKLGWCRAHWLVFMYFEMEVRTLAALVGPSLHTGSWLLCSARCETGTCQKICSLRGE